jgi:hypothetical protein
MMGNKTRSRPLRAGRSLLGPLLREGGRGEGGEGDCEDDCEAEEHGDPLSSDDPRSHAAGAVAVRARTRRQRCAFRRPVTKASARACVSGRAGAE